MGCANSGCNGNQYLAELVRGGVANACLVLAADHGHHSDAPSLLVSVQLQGARVNSLLCLAPSQFWRAFHPCCQKPCGFASQVPVVPLVNAACPHPLRHWNPPPERGGLGIPWASQACESQGCSSTPPNRRTASSAALKHPPSSPSLNWWGLRVLPCQNLPHRWHGGCATTGCGPAYFLASRFSSHGSTPGRPK